MKCLLAVSFLALSAITANAQQSQCAPHADLVKGLADQYKEIPVARGLINEKLMMEKFASVAGTWTDVVTNEKGLSCITASGESFEFDTAAFDKAKKGESF